MRVGRYGAEDGHAKPDVDAQHRDETILSPTPAIVCHGSDLLLLESRISMERVQTPSERGFRALSDQDYRWLNDGVSGQWTPVDDPGPGRRSESHASVDAVVMRSPDRLDSNPPFPPINNRSNHIEPLARYMMVVVGR